MIVCRKGGNRRQRAPNPGISGFRNGAVFHLQLIRDKTEKYFEPKSLTNTQCPVESRVWLQILKVQFWRAG
jgi:hypothetical protein